MNFHCQILRLLPVHNSNLVLMKGFIYEVLYQSHMSGCVLQTALCYLKAIHMKVPQSVKNLHCCYAIHHLWWSCHPGIAQSKCWVLAMLHCPLDNLSLLEVGSKKLLHHHNHYLLSEAHAMVCAYVHHDHIIINVDPTFGLAIWSSYVWPCYSISLHLTLLFRLLTSVQIPTNSLLLFSLLILVVEKQQMGWLENMQTAFYEHCCNTGKKLAEILHSASS